MEGKKEVKNQKELIKEEDKKMRRKEKGIRDKARKEEGNKEQKTTDKRGGEWKIREGGDN